MAEDKIVIEGELNVKRWSDCNAYHLYVDASNMGQKMTQLNDKRVRITVEVLGEGE